MQAAAGEAARSKKVGFVVDGRVGYDAERGTYANFRLSLNEAKREKRGDARSLYPHPLLPSLLRLLLLLLVLECSAVPFIAPEMVARGENPRPSARVASAARPPSNSSIAHTAFFSQNFLLSQSFRSPLVAI